MRRQQHEYVVATRTNKDLTNERPGLFHLGRFGSLFHCFKGCPKAGKKSRKTQKKVSFPMVAQFSGPNANKFPASPPALNDVEQRPSVRTPKCNLYAIICDTKKKHHDQRVRNSIWENKKPTCQTEIGDSICNFPKLCFITVRQKCNVSKSVKSLFG